jgi:hypothetical protein
LKKKLAATHVRISSLVHQLFDEKARKKWLEGQLADLDKKA